MSSNAVPLKKRRGRPPKYLMVWQQQQQQQQQQAGQHDADSGQHAGQPQSSLLSDRISPTQRPVSIITPLPRALDNGPTDVNNNLVGSGACSVQPLKKRPGRPPGCTKRPRPTPLGFPTTVAGPRTDFSLRKFFEAGGRDYNEYLEWITLAKSCSSITPSESQPSSGLPIAFSQHPLSSFAAFPGPVLPGSPPGALTPPAAAAAGSTPPADPAPSQSSYSPNTAHDNIGEALDLSAKKQTHFDCDPLRQTDDQKENVNAAMPRNDPGSWSVDRVAEFVSSVPGCHAYAQDFRDQQIDGTSLPHLSEEHLLNCVRMKLGPAIRLRLAISRLQPAC